VDEKIQLKVQGLANAQVQSGAYALILSEDGPRRIPVIIGLSEAQSIAIALEGVKTPRPLTHDLFVHFAKSFRIHLQEVFIHKLEDGVFYSELVFGDGVREVRVDARTSDAIAIAIRMNSPIYTLESIIQKCGIVLDETTTSESDKTGLMKTFDPKKPEDKEKIKEWLNMMENTEIEEYMEKAIREENYEFAKLYKDELQRRDTEGAGS
jgi:bifunctional DNase/RNase